MAANAVRFMRDVERAAPMRITRVVPDTGKKSADWLFGLRKRAPYVIMTSTALRRTRYRASCRQFGCR